MKGILYTAFTLILLTFFSCNIRKEICSCCDKSFTSINDAIFCFEQTKSENETSSDSRLLLIAFVEKDIEANQKLGWKIIGNSEIIEEAKEKYALIILDSRQYKTLYDSCASQKLKQPKKYNGKPFFVITNQALCVFGTWTLDDDNESIIDELGIGDGP